MLFHLSDQNFPDAIHTSIIPEEYAGINLPGHAVHVIIFTVEQEHKSIPANQDYVAALLREDYFDIAF